MTDLIFSWLNWLFAAFNAYKNSSANILLASYKTVVLVPDERSNNGGDLCGLRSSKFIQNFENILMADKLSSATWHLALIRLHYNDGWVDNKFFLIYATKNHFGAAYKLL